MAGKYKYLTFEDRQKIEALRADNVPPFQIAAKLGVHSPSGRTLHVWATSSDQAKRIYCREYGLTASDYWCGVRSLRARKLKPEEVKAWEEQAPIERATYLFIRGMLEISAKAYAERGCAQ